MTWNNNTFNNPDLFKEIAGIREASDKRRSVEEHVLAENNLASVRQLSEDKRKKFIAIVDALLENKTDVNLQLFPESENLVDTALKMKTAPWADSRTLSEDTNLQ